MIGAVVASTDLGALSDANETNAASSALTTNNEVRAWLIRRILGRFGILLSPENLILR